MSSLDLLDGWLASEERGPGPAVIEDLTSADPRELIDTSRQPDPAVTPPSPEDDGDSDARGSTGAAPAAPVVTSPLTAAIAPREIDLSVEAGGRRVAGFLLFASSVVTVIQAGVAYADPGAATLGLTAVLALATLAARRSWGRRTDARAVVVGSRLEVVRAGSRHVFDLADARLGVDVVGVPGDRSWRVLFHRRGLAPYVLDATVVDPEGLLRVLHASRPEVRYRPH